MAGYQGKDEYSPRSPYASFGATYPGWGPFARQDVTGRPEQEMNRLINWGAPAAEITINRPESITRTGRNVLKEMTQANKVKYSVHAPIDSKIIEPTATNSAQKEQNKKMFDSLSDFSKDSGARLINIHPTNSLPNLPDQYCWLFDNNTQQPLSQPVQRQDVWDEINKKPRAETDQEVAERFNNQQVRSTTSNMVIEKGHYDGFLHNSQTAKAQLDLIHDFEKLPKDEKEKMKQLMTEQGVMEKQGIDFENLEKSKIDLERVSKQYNAFANEEKELMRMHLYNQGKWMDPETLHGFKDVFSDGTTIEDKRITDFIDHTISHSGTTPQNMITLAQPKFIEAAADNLALFAEKASKNGVPLMVENTDSRFMFDALNTAEIIHLAKEKLKERGIDPNSINMTLDTGHAHTWKGEKITNPDGSKREVGDVVSQIQEIKEKYPDVRIKHIHTVDSPAGFEEHTPWGEVAGGKGIGIEGLQKIREELEKRGEWQDAVKINESGSLGPLGHQISMRNIAPQYFSVNGQQVGTITARGVYSEPVDAFMRTDRDAGYFYGSWVGSIV